MEDIQEKKDDDLLVPVDTEHKDQEIIFGMCQKCFDEIGLETIIERVQQSRAVMSKQRMEELKKDTEIRN